MSDILIRGIPQNVRNRIQHYADLQNLSVNQYVLLALKRDIEQRERDKEKEKRRRETFKRIDEIREAIYKRHGLLDDSTKLIREDRNNR